MQLAYQQMCGFLTGTDQKGFNMMKQWSLILFFLNIPAYKKKPGWGNLQKNKKSFKKFLFLL